MVYSEIGRLLEGRCLERRLFQRGYQKVRRLFEAGRLLEEIWYIKRTFTTEHGKA